MRSLGEKGEKGPRINGSERNQCLGNKNVFDLESLRAQVRPLRSSRSVRNCAHSHADVSETRYRNVQQFFMLSCSCNPFFSFPAVQAAFSLSSNPLIEFAHKSAVVRQLVVKSEKNDLKDTKMRPVDGP